MRLDYKDLLVGETYDKKKAWELLTGYNQDEFHLQRAQTVEQTIDAAKTFQN